MTEDEERRILAKWSPILDQLGKLVEKGWDRSMNEVGLNADPKMVSIQLFKRLKGHRNAFALLANNGLAVDGDIICRSALETAICLVNLNGRREAFVEDLRSDAARTIKGQIPIWFDKDPDLGQEARDGVADIFGASRADGSKHKPFEWKALADQAAVPYLYRWYKYLSGTAAHVTGISVAMDAAPIDDPDSESKIRKLRRLRKTGALAMMCGATQIGVRFHANTLGYEDIEAESLVALEQMAEAGVPGSGLRTERD